MEGKEKEQRGLNASARDFDKCLSSRERLIVARFPFVFFICFKMTELFLNPFYVILLYSKVKMR